MIDKVFAKTIEKESIGNTNNNNGIKVEWIFCKHIFFFLIEIN